MKAAVDPLLKAEAVRIYVPGVFGYKHVAKVLGLNPTTVRRLVNPVAAERDRKAALANKRRRTGTCRECGGVTRYNGHDQAISTRCATCARRSSAATMRKRIGSGPTQARILDLLADGPKRFMEIATDLDMTKGHVAAQMHRMRNHGLIVRISRGLYALPPNTQAQR